MVQKCVWCLWINTIEFEIKIGVCHNFNLNFRGSVCLFFFYINISKRKLVQKEGFVYLTAEMNYLFIYKCSVDCTAYSCYLTLYLAHSFFFMYILLSFIWMLKLIELHLCFDGWKLLIKYLFICYMGSNDNENKLFFLNRC